LRRHAESTQRWKTLRDRIVRTDAEMEQARRILFGGEITPSESGSTTSGPTTSKTSRSRNGFLTPDSGSQSGKKSRASTASALSRSMSPLRKFARKFTGASSSSGAALAVPTVASSAGITPVSQAKVVQTKRAPSSEPTIRHRASLFSFRDNQPLTPTTPHRSGHRHTASLTPESSPVANRIDQNTTIKGWLNPNRQPWNSSTKVEDDERFGLGKSPRPSVGAGLPARADYISSSYSPYQRSVSRSSMASSRPWSPVTSSASTAPSSYTPLPLQRPPSRTYPSSSFGRPPSRSQTPSFSNSPGAAATPRPRPKTPSHIPAPVRGEDWHDWSANRTDVSWDDDDDNDENHLPTTLMQRAFSPTQYSARCETPGGTRLPGPRPPSRSMIPAPTFQFSSPSRPGSVMSDYSRAESPLGLSTASSSLRSGADVTVRSRAHTATLFQTQQRGVGASSPGPGQGYTAKTARPSHYRVPPPSSFRETPSVSRAPSRADREQITFTYIPGNPRDPLDVEVAAVANALAHGLLVERVDPPLRVVPKEGEEIRAQYVITNSIARKVVTCRLTTLSRANGKSEGSSLSKKVMVRVGGGALVV